MEDENKVELEEAEAEETTLETQTEETEDSEEETEETSIDYKAELERVSQTKEKPTELEKAKKALYFNAERLKELGGDPADVLKIKPVKTEEPDDIDSKLERKFIERDVQALVKNEDEYNLVMHYVDKGLTVEDAHLLANKGRVLRSVEEAKRGNVRFGTLANEKKPIVQTVPDRSPEEKAVLQRRGLTFNPKTKTYQGKYTEEYYDQNTKSWMSRKLPR